MPIQVEWTPRGESSTTGFSISDAFGGLYKLQGFRKVDRQTSFSIGGKATTVIHGAHFEYLLEARAVSINTTDGSDSYLWSKVQSFITHIEGGGEFAFGMDWTDRAETTLSSTGVQGDTDIYLTSTASIEAGDWLYLEDVNDQSRFEIRKVGTVGTPCELRDGLTMGMGSGSYVKSWEYFSKNVALPRTLQFQERPGGRGVNLWDLRIKFRSVT